MFGSSWDTYWALPEGVRGQFIRMRERDGIRQLTVKGKDRGSNLNRVEIDVDVTSSVESVRALLTAAHGKPAGRLGKNYWVFFLSTHETVCCYEVLRGDLPWDRVVVEVESTSEERVQALTSRVCEALVEFGLEVQNAPGSLYEMFLEGGKET